MKWLGILTRLNNPPLSVIENLTLSCSLKNCLKKKIKGWFLNVLQLKPAPWRNGAGAEKI